MGFHVRVCRECGEEYRPVVDRCADCGGELEDVYEDEGGPPSPRREVPAEPEPIDLSDQRVLFQTPRAPDLVPLAERLKEAAIAFRLVEEAVGEGAARFSLVVPEGDTKSALDTLADLLAPHAERDSVHALESNYESGRYVRCPACGAEQGSGLTECAECGLTLAPAVPTCPRCQSPLEEEGAPCTVCGGPSPTG